MEHYYGTKAIKAMPMNRQEYTNYRGWQLPADENGTDEGMLVEYIDGGKPNDSRHEGYISWSPIDVFNNAYKKSTTPADRMRIELNEATERLVKLDTALAMDGFEAKVGKLQYELMKAQSGTMNTYVNILQSRLDNL